MPRLGEMLLFPKSSAASFASPAVAGACASVHKTSGLQYHQRYENQAQNEPSYKIKKNYTTGHFVLCRGTCPIKNFF